MNNKNKPKKKSKDIKNKRLMNDNNINNVLEINLDSIQNNNSDISGITPIKKNNKNNQMVISNDNSVVGNNTKKQLITIFDDINKENNIDNNKEEKNNYSKEVESLLLNNLKDLKLNQTHFSENCNESMLQNQIKELKNRSKTMKDKLTIFLKLMKKYSSKLTTLTHLSSNNNLKNNDNSYNKKISINNEIQSTLSQLNNMLNNPKLNEDIFELPDLTTDLTNNNISLNINTTNNNIDNNPEEKLNFNQQSFTIPANTNFNINTNTPTLSMIKMMKI